MRFVFFGILAAMAVCSAHADVLYSYTQPEFLNGATSIPGVHFEFTTPSFLTTLTEIPGSSMQADIVHFMGLDLSILSVLIDPGMKNGPYWLGPGIPYLGIRMGWGSQVVVSEGMCFVPDHYGCAPSPDAQVFDHFGVYTIGDSALTISSTDPLAAAIPEPRFETVTGLGLLLVLAGSVRKLRGGAASQA